jgi:hypothetical protein
MSRLLVSAAGSFVFVRGFRLVATGKEGPDTESSIRVKDSSRKPLAGLGAALFLLACITNEALAMIRALSH